MSSHDTVICIVNVSSVRGDEDFFFFFPFHIFVVLGRLTPVIFFIFFLMILFCTDEHGWYFWEVTLMLQKMFLTGAMVAIAPGSPIQLLIALIMCLGYLLLVTHAGPYKGDLEDRLAFLTSLCLATSLLLGLTIIMDDPDFPVFNTNALGFVLIAVNLLPFFFLCYSVIEICRFGPEVGLWHKDLTDEEMEEHIQQMYAKVEVLDVNSNDGSDNNQIRRKGSKKQEREKNQASIKHIHHGKRQGKEAMLATLGGVARDGKVSDEQENTMSKMEFAKICCTIISETMTAEMVDDLWSSEVLRAWLLEQSNGNNSEHSHHHHNHKMKIKKKKKVGFSRVSSIRSLAKMAVVMNTSEQNVAEHEVTKKLLVEKVKQQQTASHVRLGGRLAKRKATILAQAGGLEKSPAAVRVVPSASSKSKETSEKS